MGLVFCMLVDSFIFFSIKVVIFIKKKNTFLFEWATGAEMRMNIHVRTNGFW